MHLVPKVTGRRCPPVEISCKMRGCYAREEARSHALCVRHARKWCVHLQRISSLVGDATTKIAWVSGILYNQKDFDPKNRTKREVVHWRFVNHALCVSVWEISAIFDSLLLDPLICTFSVIKRKKKKKRKEADNIFIHLHCYLSLLYITLV